ncbi:MAG: hypothetical protein HGB37_04090 [Candidatus Moranbacteria bacterium]|nr:hypothetical protein [Candidatus Moranbacteria bacterium]
MISRIHCINNNKNEALNYLRIAEQNNPRSYPVSLTKSVYEFLYNSNVEASFSAIKQAKRLSIKGQLEWRYNWAFLKFWNGEYKDAYAMCRKINNQRYEREDSTLDEVEVFNRDLLKKEPEKTQLYFWIGYLAYKKRGDILKAKSLFDQYLSQTNGKAQEYLVMLAKSFLSEINNKSNLGNS